MNKIILMGRLTRDPEVRYGDNQKAVGRFALAVDRKFAREGDPTADFFNCVTFGKIAEFAESYLRKGTKVLLSGRVQNDNYTNGNGERVYTVNVVVEGIEFAESKGASQGSSSEHRSSSPADNASNAPAQGFMNLPNGIDDELPFN